MIYVAVGSSAASDSNPGTKDKPLKSLSEALSRANLNDQQGKGTKIIIKEGKYREYLSIGSGQRPNKKPLVLECVTPGNCIVTGSNVYTGWSGGSGGIYNHAWRFNWGLSNDPWLDDSGAAPLTDMARRREIVFVDGTLMRQYLSYGEMSSKPGSYYVDEASDKLYVHAPSGVNLNNATVEVAERATAVNVNGQQNIIFRGLVFEHTANLIPNGAVFIGQSSNIAFEDCQSRWNNWAGIKFWKTQNITIQRTQTNDNGAMGMGGSKHVNYLFEDVQANRNNLWRGGEWGQNYKPWAVAGMKWLSMEDVVMRRVETSGNGTHGLWFDWSNKRIKIEDLTSCHNRSGAFFFEASPGPLDVDRALICFNEGLGGGDSPGGLRITNGKDITVRNSIFYGNAKAQLYSPNRGSSNVERNGIRSGNWNFNRVVMVSTSAEDHVANVPWRVLDGDQIITSIKANNNLYYHLKGMGTGSFMERTSNTNKSFADWKNQWKTDGNTVFEEPLFVDPENMDFRPRNDSPLRGWALPTGQPGGSSTPSNSLPTVAVTAPANQVKVGAPADVVIEANASDSDGSIDKVEFFAGMTKLGEDFSAPYRMTWSNVLVGSYSLTARATDNGGAMATSAPVNITVIDPQPAARLTADPKTGTAPLTVTLDASASTDADGSLTGYAWEFGDGGRDHGVRVSHTFSQVGTYTVKLTVTDNTGLTSEETTTIVVEEKGALAGPVMHLDFDEGSGTTSYDATGNGHDAMFQGSPIWSGGKLGGAVKLDGTTDYLSVSTSPRLDVSNALTIMGWFRHDASGGDASAGVEKRKAYRLLAKESNAASSHWLFDFWDTSNNFNRIQTNAAVTNGAWHHVAATYDGQEMKVYLDGVLDNSKLAGGGIGASNMAFEIGRRDGSKYYAGSTDEVSVYDVVLTQQEIQQVMNGGGSTVLENQAPEVTVTRPAGGTSANAGDDLVIEVKAADNDGSVAEVAFFQGTTKLGQDTSAPYSFTWTNVPAGSYSLTAKATDNMGATSASAAVAIKVTAVNKIPTVAITAPVEGDGFGAGSTVAIKANAADSDGTIAKVAFFQGSTKLGEDLSAPYAFSWIKVPAGSYVLTARAIDNKGATKTSAAVNITVTAVNEPPTVALTAPANAATITGGSNLVLKANASDGDGSVAEVAFFQGTTKLGQDTSAPYSFTWTNVPAGSYSLTAKATDDDGVTRVSKAVSITVVPSNRTPVVAITSPDEGDLFQAGKNITVQVMAKDPDGQIAKVEFYRGDTKFAEDDRAPYAYTWKRVPGGEYTLTAKAIDNKGAATVSAPVHIKVNTPPWIAILRWLASDPFGTTTSEHGTALDPSTPETLAQKGMMLGDGAAGIEGAAQMTQALVDGTVVPAGKNLALEVEADDSDGKVIRVEFFQGGIKLGEDDTAPFKFKWKNVPEGTFTLSAKATDDRGATTESAPVKISAELIDGHKVRLKAGWNLVSLAVAPKNARMDTVLAGINSDVILVKDAAGRTYSPEFGINNIGDWHPLKSYLVLMKRPLDFNVIGRPIASEEMQIPLLRGWNFVPYLQKQAQPIAQALGPIMQDIVMVKDSEGRVFNPAFGINTIGTMKPGEGYKILVARAGLLTYRANQTTQVTAAVDVRPALPAAQQPKEK